MNIQQQAFPDDVNYGMTLRDYFAAKALQPLIQIYEPDSEDGFLDLCADSAYAFADAMLKARER